MNNMFVTIGSVGWKALIGEKDLNLKRGEKSV